MEELAPCGCSCHGEKVKHFNDKKFGSMLGDNLILMSEMNKKNNS